MDLSRWWKAFLMTFDGNHGRECGKSLTMKVSCIRNLFHQERRWMENSIAAFWGDWGKHSVQTSKHGATTPGPCIMTTLWLINHSMCTRFLLLQIWQSSPYPPYLLDLATCEFFLFPKMKLKLKGWRYDGIEEIQTGLQNVMKMLMQNSFQNCFRLWKTCWNLCINVKGD